jgi:hypothetical protein
MNNLSEKNRIVLHELADLQHPLLKGHNHTGMLIDKIFNGEKLTTAEAFDCGKYYQRMLDQLDQLNDLQGNENHFDYLQAILEFKWSIYNN